MSGRRLLMAVSKTVQDEAGRKMLVSHMAKQKPEMQERYAEMLEDVCAYRDVLIEHRIGEFQASQKEKVEKTARLVGLSPPKLYNEKKD